MTFRFRGFKYVEHSNIMDEEEFTTEWCIRGYHIYQGTWTAIVGEELHCELDLTNSVDTSAVAVIKDGQTVGHVPRKISIVCSTFIRRGGVISCQVTGARHYSEDLPQGGLEVPCLIKFKGPGKEIKKVIKLVTPQVPVPKK